MLGCKIKKKHFRLWVSGIYYDDLGHIYVKVGDRYIFIAYPHKATKV